MRHFLHQPLRSAENVLAGENASLLTEAHQTRPTVERPSVVKANVGGTKKMVTWSEHDTRNASSDVWSKDQSFCICFELWKHGRLRRCLP